MKKDVKEVTPELLKAQLEEVESKADKEFADAYNALCEKYHRALAFVYQAGIAGQPLKGELRIVRK